MPRHTQPQREYEGVLPGIDEHYWHPAGVKGYWSIIKPYGQVLVNAAVNPSFETNANGWVAINSATITRSSAAAIHGGYGLQVVTTATGQGAGYEMYTQFSLNTPYCACISIDGPAGTVASLKFEHNPPPGSVVTVAVPAEITLPGYPVRICARMHPTSLNPFLPTLPISVRFDRAGTYYIDGLVLTTTVEPVTSFFDGDSQDAGWQGIPHASASATNGFSRVFGEPVDFNEIGFNVTGATGFGLSPRQLITTPFARLDGAHLQRIKNNPRIIAITGTVEGEPTDMHVVRNDLVDALSWRFEDQCAQESILIYQLRDECGCQVSPQLQLPVAYQSGLEGNWGTWDKERATLIFAANSQQSWSSEFDSSADLALNGTSVITYTGTAPAWLNVNMWPGGGGLNVASVANQTTGHEVNFGTPSGNPTALPLAFGQYAILRTAPAQRISLDLYTASSQTRIMYYINHTASQVGMLRLVPGENQFHVDTPIASIGSRVFLTWKNKYKSVDHLCAGLCAEAT